MGDDGKRQRFEEQLARAARALENGEQLGTRIEGALVGLGAALEARVASEIEKKTEQLAKSTTKEQRKAERRKRREQIKQLRHQRKLQQLAEHHGGRGAAIATGVVMLVFALLTAGIAALHPDKWWLLFVGLGLGMGGAGAIFGGGNQAPALPAAKVEEEESEELEEGESERASLPPAPAAPVVDALEQRAREACARVRSELEKATPGVRDWVGDPKKVLEPLERTVAGLGERIRTLQALLAASSMERLQTEHSALVRRLDDAKDEGLRSSVMGALEALEKRRKQRGDLELARNRLEVEQQRVALVVEGLEGELLRLRIAGADRGQADVALTRAVEELGTQVGAVAEALEAEQRGFVTTVQAIGESEGSRGSGERVR